MISFIYLIYPREKDNITALFTVDRKSIKPFENVELNSSNFRSHCIKGFHRALSLSFLRYNYSLGCALVSPGKNVEAIWNEEHDPLFGYYRAQMITFLNDVSQSKSLNKNGIVFFITEDDSSIPSPLAEYFLSMNTPFLSHSHSLPLSNVVLSPDFHFIASKGFFELRKSMLKEKLKFTQRSRSVFWRGSTTGRGCDLNLRVQMCNIASILSWCDMKISSTVQECAGRDLGSVNGDRASEVEWIRHRGIVDIDGNVNAWGLFWRLVSGSVVFKIDSDFVSPYSKDLVPWQHYIPVFKNLSNIANVTKMIIESENDSLLENISLNAFSLVNQYTYDSEVRRVASELQKFFLSDILSSVENSFRK